MGARGGHKPKDAPISEGFNPLKKGGMSMRELKAAERQALVVKRALQTEKTKIETTMAKLTEKQASLSEELGERPGKPVVEEPVLKDHDAEDEKSAYQMLSDLRYAYRNSKGAGGAVGKRRLVELMESDPEFKFMVKELMKIESALLAAKIRTKEGPGDTNQMVFVVLKGLEDEKKFEADGGVLDVKQIARAMNPDGSEYGG
jgi:hypothetical protein